MGSTGDPVGIAGEGLAGSGDYQGQLLVGCWNRGAHHYALQPMERRLQERRQGMKLRTLGKYNPDRDSISREYSELVTWYFVTR